MDSGDLIDLDIEDVAHGGVFVGRVADGDAHGRGRVVFVPDTLPGERVRVRLTEVSPKSYWRGETVEVLDASPDRRPHVWDAADVSVAPDRRPGGAEFGHIDLDAQRRLKLAVLRTALERTGGLDVPSSMSPPTPITDDAGVVILGERPDAAGWRTRVSLHVDTTGAVGPYAARSHRVIPVDTLPLATPAIAEAAAALAADGAHRDAGRIDLVQPYDGRVRVLRRPQRDDSRRGGSQAGGTQRGGPQPRRGDRRRGRGAARPPQDPALREVVTEWVRGIDFRVAAGGFWQVHQLAAHTLTGAVSDALRRVHPAGLDPDAEHLDLYGGVGLFAATLAAQGAVRVTSVESDRAATALAAENLADESLTAPNPTGRQGARAETGRVDRWLPHLADTADARRRDRLARGVVLLDPPRAGAGRQVVDAVAQIAPDTVVYVACDPVALARDLATFAQHGYRVDGDVSGFDLFPHTHHVEAVAVLRR